MDVLSSRVLLRPSDPARTGPSTATCSAWPSTGSSGRRSTRASCTSWATGCWRCRGGPTEPPRGLALWLQVRDVAAEHARLAAAGVPVAPAAAAGAVGPGRDVDRGPRRRPDRAGGGPGGPSAAPRPALSRRPADCRPAERSCVGDHAQARRRRGARLPAARRSAPARPAGRASAPPAAAARRAATSSARRPPTTGGPGCAVETRWRGWTAARRSPSCSWPACRSTTWPPAAPLAESGVGGIFLAGRSAGAGGRPGGDGRRAGRPPRPGPGSGWRPTRRAARSSRCRAPGSTRCPRPSSRAPCPPAELAALADRLGASLHDAGVNLDLAPVVDVVPAGHGERQPADRRLRPAVRQHRRRRSSPPRGRWSTASPRTGSPRRSSTSPGSAGCSGNTDTAADGRRRGRPRPTTSRCAAFGRPGRLPGRSRS